MEFTWLFLMNEIWKKNMLCQPKKTCYGCLILWYRETMILSETILALPRQYSQACGHLCFFLPNFFLPVNFAFNMLWYSTLWTATSFSNDPLWLTLFVEVSMIVFWIIAKSAVFPIIVVSKNKRYPEFILYGFIEINCHLLKRKCKYSKIEILDFWLSWAVSSIIKIKPKKHLKCFNLHIINLKYMKVSLFELFHNIQIFWDVPLNSLKIIVLIFSDSFICSFVNIKIIIGLSALVCF